MTDLGVIILIVFCLFGGFLRACDFVWDAYIKIKQWRDQ